MKKNITNLPEKKNRDYFKSLITTRASIDNLALYLAALMIGFINVIAYWFVPKDYGMNSLTNPIVLSLIISNLLAFAGAFSVIIPTFKKKLYKHQRSSSIWQFLFSVGLTINLILLAIAMIVYKKDSFSYKPIYAVCLVFGIIYVISMLYHIYWLRGQLQHGFSSEHTEGNYSSQKKVQSAGSMALIFSGTVLARYMTAGQANIFGMIAGLLFVVAFSRLNLEYFYLILLKWNNREYWEEYQNVEEIGISKPIVRVILEILVLFILAYIRTDVLANQSPFVPLLQLLPKLFILYWLIRVLLWVKRKYFTRNKK